MHQIEDIALRKMVSAVYSAEATLRWLLTDAQVEGLDTARVRRSHRVVRDGLRAYQLHMQNPVALTTDE